jgi:hypothetical protein
MESPRDYKVEMGKARKNEQNWRKDRRETRDRAGEVKHGRREGEKG